MKQVTGAFLLAIGVASAAVPDLEKGVYLQANGSNLTVATHTAPSAIDWNSDGRKDLLTGQFTSGNMWLFLNQGTDASPVLGAGQQLRVGGSVITTSYG